MSSSIVFGIQIFILLISIHSLQCFRLRRDLGVNNTQQFGDNDFEDSPYVMPNNNNQFSSSHDLLFVNNGCEYHVNGYIRENGGAPRRATEAEEAQVQAHLRQMKQYQEDMQRGLANQMQQMSQQMNEMFAPPFPFGQRQQSPGANTGFGVSQFQQMPIPQFPCLCDSCKRQAGFGVNAANNYNQYSVIGQQQQQRGGPQQQQQMQNGNLIMERNGGGQFQKQQF